MADTYACTGCKKTRPGRFTRPKSGGIDSGWRSRGVALPSWYCWTCLKPGQGKDETEETTVARKKATETAGDATVLPIGRGKPEMEQKSREVLALMPPLQLAVAKLTVTDDATYGQADLLLGRVRQARGVWGQVWTRIQERTIKPIRDGLEELYSLNRDVDKPFEELEASVKAKMKAFKLEEARLIQAHREGQEREAAKLRRQMEEKLTAEQAAKTPQMRGRIAAARERIEEEMATVVQREAPLPVMGGSSSTRSIPKPRILSMTAFIKGAADGYIPEDCLVVDQQKLMAYYKEDPDGMKAWPGVEIYTDVSIVGR